MLLKKMMKMLMKMVKSLADYEEFIVSRLKDGEEYDRIIGNMRDTAEIL